jgi:hypothetical protein
LGARGRVAGSGSMLATMRKVAGSIPNEVIFFSINLSNPSNRTLALGLNQPLPEMSTMKLPRVKWSPARKANKLTAICKSTVGTLHPTTLRASTACYKDNFTFFKNSVASVRERTIPTERPPLVGEVSATFAVEGATWSA